MSALFEQLLLEENQVTCTQTLGWVNFTAPTAFLFFEADNKCLRGESLRYTSTGFMRSCTRLSSAKWDFRDQCVENTVLQFKSHWLVSPTWDEGFWPFLCCCLPKVGVSNPKCWEGCFVQLKFISPFHSWALTSEKLPNKITRRHRQFNTQRYCTLSVLLNCFVKKTWISLVC